MFKIFSLHHFHTLHDAASLVVVTVLLRTFRDLRILEPET